jgi:GAF domain-containing protein/anti-sigma regulatory factor (Ser/Thr protein kinase)
VSAADPAHPARPDVAPRLDEARGSAAAHPLDELTDAALAHLSPDDLLVELLERIAKILDADTAAILLVEDEEGTTLRARAAKGLEEEVRQGFRIPVGVGFAGRVAATREPVTLHEVTPRDVVNPLLLEKGVRSLLGVPLIVQERLVGVLHVGTLTPRQFTPADTQLLQVVADRAALAIEHARLLADQQHARAEAERALVELRNVQHVTDAALAHLDLDNLLCELLARITEVLRTDTAAILLLKEDEDVLIARAAVGLEEEVEEGFTLPVGAGFAGRVAATQEPVVLNDVKPGDVVNPLLLAKGIRSMLGVPLLVEGRLNGVLHVGTLEPRSFAEDDIRLLGLVADRAALAIEHNRLFEAHRAVEAIQRSLLPGRLPDLAGLAFAARYQSAATETPVGGDWYDVIVREDGTVGLAIGDVVGRGTEAAALMGQLRSALRAHALETASPAEVAERLARFAQSFQAGDMATFAYGVLDWERGTMRFVSGAHLPPLVVRGDGTASFAAQSPGVPLGAGGNTTYQESEVGLEAGDTVLLYTDGLVERRDEGLATRLDDLARAAAIGPRDPDLLCGYLLETMLDATEAHDDVALLAVRAVEGFGPRLHVAVPARPAELAGFRRLLRRWLAEMGATEHEIEALTLASNEACANAMEHAYGPEDAKVEATADLEEDTVTITIRDHGRWRSPRGDNRGRGLVLMNAYVDSVELARHEDGTVVRLTQRLEGHGA